MSKQDPSRTPPSRADGEGMRVVPKRAARGGIWPWAVSVGFVALAATAWWLLTPANTAGSAGTTGSRNAADAATTSGAAHAAPSNLDARLRAASSQEPQSMPRTDPNDLASYFQPGDPEPTGAEVIEALHEAGVRTGLGAFNPPGTSPPLLGLAVPENFRLPEGYVRHHQVTDEGVPIEPILMFAPDFVLYDKQGRPIPMPADRVVPPALAPPGMPIRPIQIPPR